MIIFPAIDIIGGKPVRLFKGDFSTAEQVADDALETAENFVKAGAQWIHMVDLDGSLKKERVNSETFVSVANQTPLKSKSAAAYAPCRILIIMQITISAA